MKTCNYGTIKRLANEKIDGNISDPILVQQLQFRTSRTHDVTTRHIEKNFRVTSDKRRVIGNDTLPYGWVDEPPVSVSQSTDYNTSELNSQSDVDMFEIDSESQSDVDMFAEMMANLEEDNI